MAAHLDVDGHLVRTLQRLRGRYGTAPLRLRIPGRTVVVLLSADDVERVLRDTPDPFSPVIRPQRATLGHFEPHGVLAGPGSGTGPRQRLNRTVLDTGQDHHRELGDRVVAATRAETGRLIDLALAGGHLTWDDHVASGRRLTRRIVLGDRARQDAATTDLLRRLRPAAGRPGLHPRDRRARQEIRRRLQRYVEQPQPGSLADLVHRLPAGPGLDPVDQLPQWLLAFDAALGASYTVLALLATHAEQADRARTEVAAASRHPGAPLPYLRACVLEALRLWPSTPVILRDSTRPTAWPGGVLPTGASLAIVTPFLHRDDVTLPYADLFSPQVWLDGQGGVTTHRQEALLPFGAGPAACPGRDLVLLVTSTLLAAVLERCEVTTGVSPLDPGRPLPRTLAPARLPLLVRRRSLQERQ